jgi:hypothetical protein
MQKVQLTLFAADFPVKTFLLQESDVDLLENGLDSGLSLSELSMMLNHDGWLSKTFQAFSVQTEEPTLPSYFTGWQDGGMVWGGEYLTLNTSDSPNAAEECLLSQVLERDVPARYYLSKRACLGIIHRAEKAGNQIPAGLKAVLLAMIESQEP